MSVCDSITVGTTTLYCAGTVSDGSVVADKFSTSIPGSGSYAKMNPDGTSYGCCADTQCWTGSACVSTGKYYWDSAGQGLSKCGGSPAGWSSYSGSFCGDSVSSSIIVNYNDDLYWDGEGWTESPDGDKCTGLCSGTWLNLDGVSSTFKDNCCGDDEGEDFALGGQQYLCYNGVAKECGTEPCGRSFGISETTYYCNTNNNQWTQDDWFSINGDDSTSACCDDADDCVSSSICYNNRYTLGTQQCVGGVWKKVNGQACSSGDECASGRCIADYLDGSQYCTSDSSCPHMEEDVVFYSLDTHKCKDTSTQVTCGSDGWTESSCSSTIQSDTDGGDFPLVAGKLVSPGSCNSDSGTCESDYDVPDTCSETGELTEQTLSGSKQYSCSDWTGCWKTYYNTSSCEETNGLGYCYVVQRDLDTDTKYCSECGFNVYGSICCGDDSGERYVQSDLDGSFACCFSSDCCVINSATETQSDIVDYEGKRYTCDGAKWLFECNLEKTACSYDSDCCQGSCSLSYGGSKACCPGAECWTGDYCVPESTKVSNDRYLCNASQWADASAGNCQRIPLTYTYYSLSGAWVYATQAYATCSDACTDLGGAWKDGEVISGSRCCVSDSKESLLQLTGDQSLCDGSLWIDASSPGDDPRAVYGRYISDGSEWHKCTTEGDEISVGGVDYVCESGAWQNMVCEGQGDEFKTTCKTCNGTWLGLGGSENCCGNNVMDEFLISGSGDAQLCFGSQGVLECTSTTTCDAVSFSDGTTYYCFGNKWSKNSNFGGSVYKEYGGTGGCCGAGQCWDGTACVDEGSYGDRLCVGGSWIACNESTLCSSLTASFGTYYCTDTGWDESEELLCGIQTGVCQDGACRKCGTDFEVGDVVEGYLCSSAGIFTTGCVGDVDCTAGTECQKGICSNGQCVYESLPCGATCSAGICDGAGACSPKLGAGAGCACNELCDEGLFCGEGLCRMSDTCGDGVCQAGECSACPQDCTLEQCLDDGTCNTLIGENCRNSADCSCYSASCDPGNPKADSRGCFANICGNGVCEPGECSNCVSDCTKEDCRGNGECDLIMGETCADNPDECFCNLSVADVSYVDMEIGQYGTVTLTLENTGNVPMVVDLDLVAPGIETVLMGSRHKQINPGDTKDIEIKAKALSKGSYSINVFATGSQVQDLNVGEVAIQVASSNFLADMYNSFKGTKLYSTVFEPFEFIFGVAGILGTMFGVWRYVASKVSNPSPYVGYRRPYTGSNYYRGYYYRQGGQFRGYYRQFK